MSQLHLITPLVLTYNEAPNVARTLDQLQWAERIIVIDSFSTDETLEIIKNYPQCVVFQRKFDTHAKQWNYGLDQIQSPWVLSLDADYILSPALQKELSQWNPEIGVVGYYLPFKYCVFGKPLRGTILPPRQALFSRAHARYEDDGHTQILVANGGQSAHFKSHIHHDDRKSLSRWLWAQDRYAQLELAKFNITDQQYSRFNDWVRKQIILAPFIVFFYCLILKGGILDGWRGWYYAFQRMLAELLLSLHLLEANLRKKDKVNHK